MSMSHFIKNTLLMASQPLNQIWDWQTRSMRGAIVGRSESRIFKWSMFHAGRGLLHCGQVCHGYFLRACYVPGVVSGSGHVAVNNTDNLLSLWLWQSWWFGKRCSLQRNTSWYCRLCPTGKTSETCILHTWLFYNMPSTRVYSTNLH
jgi:hypothetical protein